MNITQERARYHEMLDRFKWYIPKGCKVYDIGKSLKHDYAEVFKDYNYKTIDRNKDTNPDIVADMETNVSLPKCDAVICNGVVEQCDNPFSMFQNVTDLLNRNGVALYGSVCLGYPEYDIDYFRFTVKGIKRALEGKYNILESSLVTRVTPSYIFIICRKK